MPQEYPIILRAFPGTVRRVDDVDGRDLYLPVEAAKPLPLIIYLRDAQTQDGTAGESGPDLTRHFGLRGLAMVSVNQSGEGVEAVHRTLRWITEAAEEYGFDPGRVGVWGLGTGGRLAVEAALAPNSGIRAVVAAYPEGEVVAQEKRLGVPPILLVHGLADDVRPVSKTELLFDALGVGGSEVTMCLVEKHGYRFMEKNDFDLYDFPRVKKYECRGGEPPVITEAPPFTFGTVETFFRRWL